MDSLLIKICGIRTSEMAYAAGLAGADFIGVVFHPQSRRYVSQELAREIATAAIEAGAIPVAVFVNQTAFEMQMICDATQIDMVQLHGSISRQQHHELPSSYQRIYVQSVDNLCHPREGGDPSMTRYPGRSEKGSPPSRGRQSIHFNTGLDPARDYLLFDNPDPGKGIPFDWDNFQYTGSYRFGVAGGLSPTNVALAIQTCKPALIDVSSGVENLSGEKDITLIKQFIGVCNDTN